MRPVFRYSCLGVALLGVLPLGQLPPQPRPLPSASLEVTSATPGHELVVDCVVLVPDLPMQLVRKRTPFTLPLSEGFVFAAFEPATKGSLVRLRYTFDGREPIAVTAPRVMVGRSVGGVTTAFVQGY